MDCGVVNSYEVGDRWRAKQKSEWRAKLRRVEAGGGLNRSVRGAEQRIMEG